MHYLDNNNVFILLGLLMNRNFPRSFGKFSFYMGNDLIWFEERQEREGCHYKIANYPKNRGLWTIQRGKFSL